MHAENVLVYHSRKWQPIKHGVARFPHFFPESFAESVLARISEQNNKKS